MYSWILLLHVLVLCKILHAGLFFFDILFKKQLGSNIHTPMVCVSQYESIYETVVSNK